MATTIRAKARTIDYTKMELGRVTRTFKGRPSANVARCPKCLRRGQRYSYIPKPDDINQTRSKPYVGVDHLMTATRTPSGLRDFMGDYMRTITDHCTTMLNKENVEDLLNVEERRSYDAWRAALIAYTDQF